ncbi:MAG: demethoxyubiquinone hydroxylase family protein [Anaerolineae bacterium]|nr:demethoxyubiquinone hydroxylase family protein [Anaerolineae bacterium]
MSRERILEFLNHDLRSELAAIEIYVAHARALQDDFLGEGIRAILEVEQRHARDLTARIRALGGTPAEPGGPETVTGRAIGAATAHADPIEMLRLELAEEQQAIRDYASQIAEIMDDDETVELFTHNLADEMQHAHWLKAQIRRLSGRS